MSSFHRRSSTCSLASATILSSAFALLAASMASGQSPFVSSVPESSPWVPDGTIEVIEGHGNAVYVGGQFSAFGPNSGSFGTLDLPSGAPTFPAMPAIDGIVRDVEPDGAGGFFVCGPFSSVGALPRDGLAHILASGDVDPWTPSIDGEPLSLLWNNGVLYVGGSFVLVNGSPRGSLCAFDSSLQLLPWNPGTATPFHQDDGIYSLVASGNALIAGGYFQNTFNGAFRRHLAYFDLATGAIQAIDPSPSAQVAALVVHGSSLFVGGNFTTIGGASRQRLAELDLATGATLPFAVAADKDVFSLALDGNILYVGGRLTLLGGIPRAACGAIDLSTGSVTPFDAAISDSGNEALEVHSLAIDSSSGSARLLLGGTFRKLGGAERWYFAMVDAATGVVTPQTANVSGENATYVEDIAVGGGRVGVGGSFRSLGALRRHGIAAFDATTLEILPWAPDIGNSLFPENAGAVSAIAFEGSTVFVGGSFGYVNGTVRARIAAIDANSGALLTSFDAGLPLNADSVRDLTVLPGGVLADISTLYDKVTGAKIPSWSIYTGTPTHAVALAENGSAVYGGGSFSDVGPVGGPYTTHLNFLKADPVSSAIAPLSPAVNKTVETMRTDKDRIILGGSFLLVEGQLRRGIAEIDTTTMHVTAFDPKITNGGDQPVLAVAQSPGIVFCGGTWQFIQSGFYPRLAAIDRAGSFPLAFQPTPDGEVRALLFHRDHLFAGGAFHKLGSGARPSFAVFPVSTLLPLGETISVSAGGSQPVIIAPGIALAGKSYWILGSASGTSPGFELLGKHVPLNLDPYLFLTLSNPVSPVFQNGSGILNANGVASAQFAIPPLQIPQLVGVTISHSAMIYSPSQGKPIQFTNPVSVTFLP